MNKKVDRKRVAALIRAARDLMNNGGKHWVKGAEKVIIVDDVHEPGADVSFSARSWAVPRKGESFGYCMLGGLKYAPGFTMEERRAAVIELARFINPEKIAAVEKRVAKAKSKYSTLFETGYYGDEVYDVAECIITNSNDKSETKWSDVKDWTTRAARRLR